MRNRAGHSEDRPRDRGPYAPPHRLVRQYFPDQLIDDLDFSNSGLDSDDYTKKLELLARDVDIVVAMYRMTSHKLMDPHIRRIGSAVDLVREGIIVNGEISTVKVADKDHPTSKVTKIQVQCLEWPIEPTLYDVVMHRLMAFRELGYVHLTAPFIHALTESRQKYIHALEGWARDAAEGALPNHLKYIAAAEKTS